MSGTKRARLTQTSLLLPILLIQKPKCSKHHDRTLRSLFLPLYNESLRSFSTIPLPRLKFRLISFSSPLHPSVDQRNRNENRFSKQRYLASLPSNLCTQFITSITLRFIHFIWKNNHVFYRYSKTKFEH